MWVPTSRMSSRARCTLTVVLSSFRSRKRMKILQCALAVTTRMRQDELLTLCWRHVDVNRGTLSVRTRLQRSEAETHGRGQRRGKSATPHESGLESIYSKPLHFQVYEGRWERTRTSNRRFLRPASGVCRCVEVVASVLGVRADRK